MLTKGLFFLLAALLTVQAQEEASNASVEAVAEVINEDPALFISAVDVEQVDVEAVEKHRAARQHGKKPRRVSACGCPDRFDCNVCDLKSSSSSSSTSSSSDCCTCLNAECARDYVADLDFYTNYPVLSGNQATWTYYADENVVADQGSLTTGCKGGLLDTKVYTETSGGQTNNPYSDNYKYFIYAKEPVAVPRAGNLVVQFLASARTFKTDDNPFPEALKSDAGDDVRFAAGYFSVFDPFVSDISRPLADGLTFSFFLTNDRVYASYQRMAKIDSETGIASSHAAFNFLIPVKVRKFCDLHEMKVVLNHSNRIVSWRLDGREVFRVNKVGYLLNREFMLSDLGGTEADAFPETIQYGFGSMTMLDSYPACLRSDQCRSCKFPDMRQAFVQTVLNPENYKNPPLNHGRPAVFWDTTGAEKNRLWGQGSTTHIRRLAVYTEDC